MLNKVQPQHLLKYGLITERVGRLPVLVGVCALDQDSLIRVLTEPKNALVKQYERIFAMDGVELSFKDGALEEAANIAMGHKTGARGLRTILEDVLMDVMYEVPSRPNVVKCMIDADVITGRHPPLLLTSEGHPVDVGFEQEKTA